MLDQRAGLRVEVVQAWLGTRFHSDYSVGVSIEANFGATLAHFDVFRITEGGFAVNICVEFLLVHQLFFVYVLLQAVLFAGRRVVLVVQVARHKFDGLEALFDLGQIHL